MNLCGYRNGWYDTPPEMSSLLLADVQARWDILQHRVKYFWAKQNWQHKGAVALSAIALEACSSGEGMFIRSEAWMQESFVIVAKSIMTLRLAKWGWPGG